MALKKVHLLRCTAFLSCQRISYTLHSKKAARLVSEAFFFAISEKFKR